jgi:hypothetical protein
LGRLKLFGSDNDPYGGPYLTLTYTGVLLPTVFSQFPEDGFQAGTLTPQLSASGGVDVADTGKLKFDFQVDDASGTKVADSGLVSGGAAQNGGAVWAVPSGKLKWGKSYYWTVQAYDGTNYSPGPVWNSLTVQVPQPAITSGLSQNTGTHGFDASIGNYTTEATDAQVATPGPSVSVVRDYNSRDPRVSGAFGAAWSSVFDARAAEQYDPSGAVASVVVTYPDGSQVGYGKNPDGSFSPPQGRFATLKAITGGYSLTDKNDTVYTFTQSLGAGSYGITAITDASGRAVNFTWASGQITTMASAVSGRALHLTWSTPAGAAAAHVASVATDPVTAGQPATALTWTYGYSGDQLTGACPPGTTTACTQYAYQAGSQYQSQVLGEGAGAAQAADEVNYGPGTYANVTLGVGGVFGRGGPRVPG